MLSMPALHECYQLKVHIHKTISIKNNNLAIGMKACVFYAHYFLYIVSIIPH